MRQGKWDAFNVAVSEYLTMDHAERVPPDDLGKPVCETFMHGVVKDSSTTTKLRIVFDASAKTSTGYSLNDILLPGPSLHLLLTTVINRFRLYRMEIQNVPGGGFEQF